MYKASIYHNSFTSRTAGYGGQPARVDQLRYTWDEFLQKARQGRYRSEAQELAVKGWPEGLRRAQAISGAIIERYSANIQQPEMRFQDHPGMDFDVSLVLSGEPEHWQAIEHIEVPGVTRIVLNCSITSGVTEDAIIRRGATVAALVQLLEANGRRVEVVVMDATDNGARLQSFALCPVIECYVTVKTAGADLDLDRVTFALAHPDMERALMFSAEGRTSHGVAVECTDRGDLYLPCAVWGEGCDWNNAEACNLWVAEQLKTQGVLMGA